MGAWLPSLTIFSAFVNPLYGALVGALWPIGRIIYAQGYQESPEKRELGWQISFSSIVILLVGGFAGIGKYVVKDLKNFDKLLK